MSLYFYAFNLAMIGEQGHCLFYHRAFQDAISSLGYPYACYINTECVIPPLPEWIPLFSWKHPPHLLPKLTHVFECLKHFKQVFQKNTSPRLFFFETLPPLDLLPLTFTLLLFFRKKDSLWLLLRYDLRDKPLKNKIFSTLLRIIQKKLKNRVTFLTDSETIKRYYEATTPLSLHVVPIPITPAPLSPSQPAQKIICWHPGRIDHEKGLQHLLFLAHQEDPKSSLFELHLCSSTSQQFLSSPLSFSFLPSLSQEAYQAQMAKGSLILLPYLPECYFSRTSNIFVEAVIYGKIPLVHAGTWLADELTRHNLPELILDWKSPLLWSHIHHLMQNQEMLEKLKKMQAHYLSYHSLKNYQTTLQSLIP